MRVLTNEQKKIMEEVINTQVTSLHSIYSLMALQYMIKCSLQFHTTKQIHTLAHTSISWNATLHKCCTTTRFNIVNALNRTDKKKLYRVQNSFARLNDAVVREQLCVENTFGFVKASLMY